MDVAVRAGTARAIGVDRFVRGRVSLPGLLCRLVARLVFWLDSAAACCSLRCLKSSARSFCTAMVDVPVTFSLLAATIFAVRYLESGKWKDSIRVLRFQRGSVLDEI